MLMKSSVLVVDSREAALAESGDVILSGVSPGAPALRSSAWGGLCYGWQSLGGMGACAGAARCTGVRWGSDWRCL